tara:strand:+ start:23006 stop:26605 length:3600 start_codon:yes stop_codon:yes gene_type:complete
MPVENDPQETPREASGTIWDESAVAAARIATEAAANALSGVRAIQERANAANLALRVDDRLTVWLRLLQDMPRTLGPGKLVEVLELTLGGLAGLLDDLDAGDDAAMQGFREALATESERFQQARSLLPSVSPGLDDTVGEYPQALEVARADEIFLDARGRAIELAALLEAIRGRARALSDTLGTWLQWAGLLAIQQERIPTLTDRSEQVYAVTPNLLIQAMLAGRPSAAVRAADGTGEWSFRDTYDALVALREYNLPPDGALYWAATEAKDSLFRAGVGARKLSVEAVRKADRRVFLMPEAVAILSRADLIRDQTIPSQARIDARHFAAACLLAPGARKAMTAMGASAAEWALLARRIETSTMENLWGREDGEAWRSVFAAVESLGPPAPERPAGALLPRYSRDKPWIGPDGALLDDPLGVVADARAMADLIVLEEPGPPLAIGLFGDWGSGKSTFMEILEKAIGESTAKAKLAREQMEAGRVENRLPFVENIAHIRFNAWHYAEADLWASLAANIFRGLLDHSEGCGRDERQLIENLIGKLSLTEQAAREAEQALDAAKVETEAARDLLGKRSQDVANARSELAKRQQGVSWADIPVGLDLSPAMRALGLGDHTPDAETLVELAGETRELDGHARYIFTALIAGERPGAKLVWRSALIAVGLAAGGIGLAVLARHFAPEIASMIAWLGSIAGVIGGAASWLVPHISKVNESLSKLRIARDQVIADKLKQEDDARNAERNAADKLAAAESAKALASLDYEAKRDVYERVAAAHRGEKPGELFLRLIEDRAGDEGYRKHLGLVSQLHDDFKMMSNLLLSATAREQRGIKPEDLPGIERIVLYIDDLDRCPDATVIKVLEAVHLLLALPLFVVVVGVDARWLEGALKREYQQQFDAGEVHPEDYLEKIFQFPYWLRGMDLSEGGSFQLFVRELLTKPERELAAQNRNTRHDAARAIYLRNEDSDVGGSHTESERASTERSERGGLHDESVYAEVEPVEEDQVEALREAVEITPVEVAAIEALGPLITKSPRSAKRFMNLYRFEKARRMRENAEAFMGTDEAVAEYPAVMLALAMEIGLPSRVAVAASVVIDRMIPSAADHGEEKAATLLSDCLLALEQADHDEIFVEDAFESLGRYLPPGYWNGSHLTTPLEDRPRFGALASVITDLAMHDEGGSSPIVEPLERLRARGDLPRASFRRPGN